MHLEVDFIQYLIQKLSIVFDTYLVYRGVVTLLHNQKLILIAPIWLWKEAFNDIEVVCTVCASSSPIRYKFQGKEPHLTLWHGNIRIYTSFIGQGNIQSLEKRWCLFKFRSMVWNIYFNFMRIDPISTKILLAWTKFVVEIEHKYF